MMSFLSKIWTLLRSNKHIFIYLLIIIVTIVLTLQLRPPKVIINDHNDSIPVVSHIRDTNDRLIAQIKQNELNTVAQKKIIDSLSSALRVKPSQINRIDRIVTKIDTLWRDSIVYISAIDSTIIKRSDRYVEILAVGKKEGSYIHFNLTPDTSNYITVTKTPLFRPPSSTIYVTHSNMYFRTTNGDSYEVKPKRILFNIAPSIGYDFLNKRIYIGIGIEPEFPKIRIYKRN